MRTYSLQFCQHSPKMVNKLIFFRHGDVTQNVLIPVSESAYQNYLWMCILKLFWWHVCALRNGTLSDRRSACVMTAFSNRVPNSSALKLALKYPETLLFQIYAHSSLHFVHRFHKNLEALLNPSSQKDGTTKVSYKRPTNISPWSEIPAIWGNRSWKTDSSSEGLKIFMETKRPVSCSRNITSSTVWIYKFSSHPHKILFSIILLTTAQWP
jgi:hypothetical protein